MEWKHDHPADTGIKPGRTYKHAHCKWSCSLTCNSSSVSALYFDLNCSNCSGLRISIISNQHHHQYSLISILDFFTSLLAEWGYYVTIPEVLNVNILIFTRICKKLLDGFKPNRARLLASQKNSLTNILCRYNYIARPGSNTWSPHFLQQIFHTTDTLLHSIKLWAWRYLIWLNPHASFLDKIETTVEKRQSWRSIFKPSQYIMDISQCFSLAETRDLDA